MIFKLRGGLGNQMFQYAYGRSWSIKNKKALKYYFIHNYGDANRCYELGIFNINGLFPELLRKVEIFLNVKFFDVVSGYWQGEKFFINNKNTIRRDFQFIKLMDRKNINILEEINKVNSVSVHVRRGDYISDKKTNEFHGVCTLRYYNNAIKKIKQTIKSPKFFVFSDDSEWVKNNLKIDNATYVNWNNGDNSYKDMQLMSHCKHNIIANSSFSWWGAWLNTSPGKIVIAPKKWFINDEAQKKSKDLIPKEWIKI
jgi:hypothetical protein